MKIAFYKSKYGNLQDKVISALTFSRYSHCEMVLESGVCVSSSPRDGGIRYKEIELGDHWDVFELDMTKVFYGAYRNAPYAFETRVTDWFTSNENDTYDLVGAIASAFSIDATSENKKFCSYSCAHVLGYSPIITPGGLFRLLKSEGVIHV